MQARSQERLSASAQRSRFLPRLGELALTVTAPRRQGEGLHRSAAPAARHHPEMQPQIVRLTTEIALPAKPRRAIDKREAH